NNSRLLILAFAIWVMSPFVGFLMADARAARWSSPARTTLHGTMLLVTAATLAIYGVVALGPPRPKPASFFLVVPPASVALLAVEKMPGHASAYSLNSHFTVPGFGSTARTALSDRSSGTPKKALPMKSRPGR